MTTARLKILGTLILLLFIAALVLAGIAYAGWFVWDTAKPEPTATAAPTATFTPSQTPEPTDSPTATSSPTHTAPATDTATATGTPTATSTATSTPRPTDAPTSTPTVSATATSTKTPAPTTTPSRPSPTPTTIYPAPSLLEPVDGARLTGTPLFTWRWNGPPLGENHLFDLRIWSAQEAQSGLPKRGAVAPTKDTEVEVDLQYVPAIEDYGGGGDYYWTVVVVRIGPDTGPEVVGEWGESRRFTYGGGASTPRPQPQRTDTPAPPPKPSPTP